MIRIVKYLIFFLLISTSCYCDVLYTFDYKIKEIFVGEKKESLLVGYTSKNRYSDKRSKLTGSFMKRWFGKEKELRYTTIISLSEDLIREVDYGRNRIIETSFSKITDPALTRKISGKVLPIEKEIINERYTIKKPVFTITELANKMSLKGYNVNHIRADLTLETYDKKKDSISRTIIKLDLFLTRKIKGYGDYLNFNKNFAKRLGINAAKFGNLQSLLKHWTFPLDEIPFEKARGIPVKTQFEVRGIYLTKPGKTDEKRVERVLTNVEIVLREAKEGPFSKKLFKAPEQWKVNKDS